MARSRIPTEDFRPAIEGLYTAFAMVPAPRWIEGCSHCLDDQEIERLVSLPLRQVSPDDLSGYASSAFLTVGDVADYLYFLPRILEVSATDNSWWPDPEVTGKAIRETTPADWPVHRSKALVTYNTAIIHAAIVNNLFDELDSWMCAIACMDLDVQPHLDQIAESRAAIVGFFDENARCLPQNRLCNPFWELPSRGHDAILEWFHSEEVRRVPFEEYGFLM